MKTDFTPYEKRATLVEPGEVVTTYGGAFEVLGVYPDPHDAGRLVLTSPQGISALRVPRAATLTVIAQFDVASTR